MDQNAVPDAPVARPTIPAADVLEVASLVWGADKRANLADPALGGVPWTSTIAIYEGTVDYALAQAARGGLHKRELIAYRRIIDQCFRFASDAPNFYGMPLYASDGFLRAAMECAERRREIRGRGKPKFPAGEGEHVLPLSLASGTAILSDPDRYLPQARRAMVGPVCRVTNTEHKRMKSTTSPDPERPFMRYAQAEVVAYRTIDGERVDPETWTFEDHLDYMATQPGFATGAALARSRSAPSPSGTSQPR